MDENFEGAGLIPISEKESKKLVKAQKKHDRLDKEWYSVRSLFGNTDCYFFYLLGARGCGKSFSVLRQFLKDWKTKKRPFTWMRLTEAQTRKLLENKADNFIDAEIKREFDLDITVKGNQLYDKGEFMCRILALSTYFNSKGVALYDSAYDLGYNICVDEIQRDQGQKNSFGSVGYALVNQLENLVRTTKEKLRIVFIGNYLEDASDVLCMFNFIPETYGRYKLRKRRQLLIILSQLRNI
jgi:Podovirus DNA encapsidation protein (Gp16).